VEKIGAVKMRLTETTRERNVPNVSFGRFEQPETLQVR